VGVGSRRWQFDSALGLGRKIQEHACSRLATRVVDA
jgi:hypothetical protein